VLTVTDAGRAAIAEADKAIAERLAPIFDRLEDPAAVLRAMEQVMAAAGEVRAERRKAASAGRSSSSSD
jgi:DNA-binding MarR family transcriptional regulator